MTWHSDQACAGVHISIPSMFGLVACDQRDCFLFVLWSGSAVLPLGLHNTSLATTSHCDKKFSSPKKTQLASFEIWSTTLSYCESNELVVMLIL